MKGYRIKRHNAIVDAQADKSKSVGQLLNCEPKLKAERQGAPETWIPDMILVKSKEAFVINPTIVTESNHGLQNAN
ncbi:hypothetical protein DPMN_143543 [Dreissena polymorpha]|uniref:Uncharacterized protein n=1 Tax=Dreissena polymorpha TaxID=45954 RepID=A0A9D4GGG6_DREPO|nr:hypothetical protein DPMN_143543 [Dreissena polymorpha]